MQPRFFSFSIAPGQSYSILLDEIYMVKFLVARSDTEASIMGITTHSAGTITYRFSEYKYFTDARDAWNKLIGGDTK